MKRLPKYYNVKIVWAYADDIAEEEVFTFNGVWRVLTITKDSAGYVTFKCMNLHSGLFDNLKFTVDVELPIHKYITRV